jgi:nitrate reductase NapAB chaperone NapD
MSMFAVDEVLAFRMKSLLLAGRETREPADVVSWMGAMQAQDLASGEWSGKIITVLQAERLIALGVVVAGLEDDDVIALDQVDDAVFFVDAT